MAVPKPIAKGDLMRTPLQHVLLSILRKKLAGTLVLWTEGAVSDRLLFAAGQLQRFYVATVSADSMRSLLPLFRERQGPYAFYPADLVGDAGTAGTVDTYALVAASLRGGLPEAAVARILAGFGEEPVRVHAREVERFALLDRERAALDVMLASTASVREHLAASNDPKTTRRVLYLLAIFDALRPDRAPTMPAPSGSKPLSAQPVDSLSLSPGRRSMAPRSLPPVATLPPGNARSVSPARGTRRPPDSALVGTSPGSVAVPARSSLAPRRWVSGWIHKSRSAAPPPPPPPPKLPTAEKLRWVELLHVSEEIVHQNYFQMLGLPSSATAEQVDAAATARLAKWDPESLPEALATLRPLAKSLVEHLEVARRTLTDATRRRGYEAQLRAGRGTPALIAEADRASRARMNFERVQDLMDEGKDAEALESMAEVVELAPQEIDFLVATAQLMVRVDGVKSPSARRDLEAVLEKALDLDPRHEDALMVKGELLRRLDRDDEAFELYTRVAALNPMNREAVQFARLGEMRRRSIGASMRPSATPKPEAGIGSLLDRLRGALKK
ncbi:MAG: hypothetical protein AAF447_00385 [Myxococcota bacterium]